jgi:RHS repeat-associated protein
VVDRFAYEYDAVGNRKSETVRQKTLLGSTDVTTTAIFNDADQLVSRGSVTYSYDANGNQTGSSAGQALAYNAADQTTSLKRAGGTALAATYAGANQVERTSAGATTFTNSLLGLTVAADSATTGYTRDPAGVLVGMRGANRSYYLFDGLGSVVAVTNASGGVTNSYTYDPYGVTTETKAALTNVVNPWRYAGQYQDVSTGLYKMGARYYQPELGRWTQPDPSGREANAYLYVAGNPASFIDPAGLEPMGPDLGNCAIFNYPDGSCFGGSIDDISAQDIGEGLARAAGYYRACQAGAAVGGAAGPAYGASAAVVGAGPGFAIGAAAGCVAFIDAAIIAERSFK